jgi:hypothetical protein
MACPLCHSDNQRIFTSEINIHGSGLAGLDAKPVFVFPELLVCMECGVTEFAMSQSELRALSNGYRAAPRAASADSNGSSSSHSP